MRPVGKQPGPGPGAAAVHRAGRGIEDDGRIGDGKAEHAGHHERRPLLRRQDPQRGVDVEPGIHRPRGIGILRQQGLDGLLIANLSLEDIRELRDLASERLGEV